MSDAFSEPFDPFHNAVWSLAMVFAWAMWRTPSKVGEYRNGNLAVLQLNSEADGALLQGFSLTRMQFVKMALAGKMVVQAVEAGGSVFSPIPAEEWRDDTMSFEAESDLSDRLVFIGDGQVGTPRMVRRLMRIARNQVLDLWRPAELTKSEPHFDASVAELFNPSGPKIGRPQKYDWARFVSEATNKLEQEGAFSPAYDTRWNQAKLEEYMAEWCSKEWNAEPGESSIRAYVNQAVKRFHEGRKGQ